MSIHWLSAGVLEGSSPVQQVPLQLTVARACGLDAAVDEAISFLGAGQFQISPFTRRFFERMCSFESRTKLVDHLVTVAS